MFWTTGCALFKYGQNKEKAAGVHQGADLRPADLEGLDRRHQERPSRPAAALQVDLRGLGRQQAGLDARRSSALVRGQLDQAKAITNHLFGLQQFVIGKPIWETYLKGEEADPKVAMQKVVDAVQAEMKKG